MTRGRRPNLCMHNIYYMQRNAKTSRDGYIVLTLLLQKHKVNCETHATTSTLIVPVPSLGKGGGRR